LYRIIPLGFLIGVLLVGTIAPFAPIQNAYGDADFTFQDRRIAAEVDLNNVFSAILIPAPDFNPFFASDSVALGDPLIGNVFADAAQDSTLNPNLITATGSASADIDISQLFSHNAVGNSFFEVEFELTTPTNYLLDGTVFTTENMIENAILDSIATVHLFDIDGSADIFSADADVLQGAFSDSGLLPPGNYRLTAVAEGSAFGNDDPIEGMSSGVYQLSLELTPVSSPPPPTTPVGGDFMPIETTSLILAGAQTFSWMIPLILSGIGIGLFVVSRKS